MHNHQHTAKRSVSKDTRKRVCKELRCTRSALDARTARYNPFPWMVSYARQDGKEYRVQMPEWHQYPVQGPALRPGRSGVLLLQNKPDCAFVKPSGHRVPTLFEQWMDQEYALIVNDAALDALFMCNQVLNRDAGEHALFEQFFKDSSFEAAIDEVFRRARRVLRAILGQEELDGTKRGLCELRVARLNAPGSEKEDKASALALAEARLILLTPNFFDPTADSWGKWHAESKIGDNKQHPRSQFTYHCIQAGTRMLRANTRGGILLHEIIHLVSFWEWDEIKTQICNSNASFRLIIAEKRIGHPGITDLSPIDFAVRDNASDDEALRIYTSPYTGCNARSSAEVAYGPARAQALTMLAHGATAAFLNADNYSWFASYCAGRFVMRLAFE